MSEAVLRFGLVGDGEADDTAAVLEYAKRGIPLPPGTYHLGTTVHLPKGSQLTGGATPQPKSGPIDV